MANVQLELQKIASANTAKTFDYNTKEAEKSRSWSTAMSNTAHQREVADLKAAGLNPVLSSGGSGAAAYSTQSASAVAESAVSALGSIEASKQAANATMFAAEQNRLASEKAAQMNSAATMYAADQSRAASMYHTDWAAEMQRYGVDRSSSGYLANIIDEIVGDSKHGSAKKLALSNAGKIVSAIATIATKGKFKSKRKK